MQHIYEAVHENIIPIYQQHYNKILALHEKDNYAMINVLLSHDLITFVTLESEVESIALWDEASHATSYFSKCRMLFHAYRTCAYCA